MYNAKVTSKGQVTIPKELRDELGIKPGSYIEIRETQAGYVIKKKVEDDCLKKYIGILDRKTTSDEVLSELRGK